ncbi:hypothetical protein K1719_026361 [Acacia pycnantha]|nr:hypothetical protein K1719_026361 [Acacia pycnantha]
MAQIEVSVVRTVVGARLDALVRFFGFRTALVGGGGAETGALSSWSEHSCGDGSVLNTAECSAANDETAGAVQLSSDRGSSRIGASPPRLPSPTLHLLFKDYHSDQKFSITTYSPDGIVITSSGTKKGDLFFADVNTQWKHRNVNSDYFNLDVITTDIKVDADSNMAEHLNFSSVVGTNILAIGTDVSYDTKSGDLTKLNAGLCFTKADFIASLTVYSWW